jgi:acyl dehydratase
MTEDCCGPSAESASAEATPAPAPATPTPTLFWEDFPPGVKRRVGGTPVTREAILEFAGRYDPQPFHLDDAAARASLFGGLCASGWHTVALTMRMLCDGYLLRAASLGSPGMDQLRWLAPVFPGDTLWVEYEVLAARPMGSRPDVGLTQMLWTVINQHEAPVMTMQGWGMFRRRPGWEMKAAERDRPTALDAAGGAGAPADRSAGDAPGVPAAPAATLAAIPAR